MLVYKHLSAYVKLIVTEHARDYVIQDPAQMLVYKHLGTYLKLIVMKKGTVM